MKSFIKIFCLLFVFSIAFTSCEVEDFGNPNAPTAEDLLDGASLADLQLLGSGLESMLRNDMGFHYNTVSMVGREYYDLRGTDPRYTGELLGAQGAILDNNGFLTTRSFSQVYRVARNANNFIGAISNSLAGLTDAQKNGLVGLTETLKAHSLLLELNRQYQNGIRVDVADANNLGGFLSYEGSLDALEASLDAAYANLTGAGASFPIALSSGFAGFDTPATFAQFNRALAARVNLYQGDTGGLTTALGQSFMDMEGDLKMGVYHVFGASGNDITNPLVVVPNQDQFMAQMDFINDADAGDMRVGQKTSLFEPDGVPTTSSIDELSSDYQLALYTSNTAPVPMIRNAELVLMMAEARLQNSDVPGAVFALNVVRTAAGLAPLADDLSTDEATDALIYERRYALFGEGHRWIDMRRWGRLDQIKTDRAGDVIHTQFPRPVTEEG